MLGGDVRVFADMVGVFPSHKALFGREATLPEVVEILERYPVTEWLSYLSRIQTMLAGDRLNDPECIARVLGGTASPDVNEKFLDFHKKTKGRTALYYEWQLSTLQQLAILHAPEPHESSAVLDSNSGRRDLSMALLLTMDLLGANQGELLPALIQWQTRMSTTPPIELAARAVDFYELDSDSTSRSTEVRAYLELFNRSTGVDAEEFLVGGVMALVCEEDRSFDDQAMAWHSLPHPTVCESHLQARAIAAYTKVRMRSLSDLRELVRQHEGCRNVRDWNLIALSRAPVCDLGDMGAFVLSHTALGRSLFDGVRHEILTAALENRLQAHDQKSIGDLYGKIFESYVIRLFESAFPGRVYRIPASKSGKRADVLIWWPDKVVVVEIKSGHFKAVKHAEYLSMAERKAELQNIVPSAIEQLEGTIDALRSGDICAPGMPTFDWTTTPIVPVIVTEERMPWVPGCWDELYQPMMSGLEERSGGAGPLAPLRLMTVGEVEQLPEFELPCEFAAMLMQWANDPRRTELTWGQFLGTQDVTPIHGDRQRRIERVKRFVADKLNIDYSLIAGDETDDDAGAHG